MSYFTVAFMITEWLFWGK